MNYKIFVSFLHIYVFFLLAEIYYYRIFIGTSEERKKSLVTKLNLEFHSYIDEGHTITSAYEVMVNKNPYKVLANFSYDYEETPLNQNLDNHRPDMTDVSSRLFLY